MKKAFTITELLVAVAVLAVTMTAVGGIFKMAIDSQRIAGATSEVMRNLRAITDQLNADFKGFRPSPIPAIIFQVSEQDPNTSDPNSGVRSDRFVFFANGDFQSTRQYKYNKSPTKTGFKTVVGNTAMIWYGQSEPDPNSPDEAVQQGKLLLRKMQILTADSTLYDPCVYDPNNPESFRREYDVRSLAEWRVYQKRDMPDPNGNPEGFEQWVGRPGVDLAEPNDIPMVMAKYVDNFTVQFSYWDPELSWWPSNEEVIAEDLDYPGPFEAIRFAFTLYDSKGILKGGRTFSHTVYLGE